MGDVAEGVLMHVEPRVGGDVDLPIDDILAVMAPRRHPQDLDHAGGRRRVAIGRGVGDAQAHDVSETELRSLIYTVIPGCAKRRPRVRTCASGNLEIPGSMLRIAPE